MTTLARTHVASRRSVPRFDWILVFATLAVSAIGVLMVYTATRGSLLAQGEDPKTFLKKQGLFVVLGFITMVVVALIDYRRQLLYCLCLEDRGDRQLAAEDALDFNEQIGHQQRMPTEVEKAALNAYRMNPQ